MRASPASGARTLYRMEQLAAGDTFLHRLHPGVKLLGTLCALVCMLSLPVSALEQLLSFVLLPAALMALGEISPGDILRRTAVALPFCLFAALANLLLERQVVLYLGPLPVTVGLVSFLSVLLRTLLCVAQVLLLTALTPISELTALLRRIHVPALLVALLEMTYRFVGTLAEEAGSMTVAYHRRAGRVKGIAMGDMGSFVGMLLLRSYDRAERVYQAMECRGYGAIWAGSRKQPFRRQDLLGLCLLCGLPVLLRLINLPACLGRWLTCWM